MQNVTFSSFLDVDQGIRTKGILSVTGDGSFGGGIAAVTNVKFSSFLDVTQGIRTNGILSVAAEATMNGVITANTGINLPGNKAVNFGSDVTKESTAGRIGYQTYTVGALDVVGAGTVFPGRVVKLWDDVIVQRNVQVGGALTASGIVTANTGVNVLGSNVLNFGSNLTKQIDAGKIGYGTFTPGALDIIGAGTSTRTIKLWDNVIVNGGLTASGGTVLGGNQTIRVYTQNVTIPAPGSANSYTLPAGVTSNNVISLTGVIYHPFVTYPFGLAQDNDYNMRAWIVVPNSLTVLNYGNAITGYGAKVTYIVAG